MFIQEYSINIYDMLPTVWKRMDPAIPEVLGLLAEDVEEVFQVILVVKLFLSQMVRTIMKHTVHRNQFWRIW